MDPSPANPAATPGRWERFSRAVVVGFRRYAEWLVSISWKKFFLLSLLLLIGAAILKEIPPFSFKFTVGADDAPARTDSRRSREERIRKRIGDLDIKIDGKEVQIRRGQGAGSGKLPPEAEAEKSAGPAVAPPAPPVVSEAPVSKPPAPPAPQAPASPGATSAPSESVVEIGRSGVTIRVPRDVADEIRSAMESKAPNRRTAEEIREAVEEVRDTIREAVDEAIAEEMANEMSAPRVRTFRAGSYLPNLALLWIVASMVIKIVYAGRVKAEVKAAVAQETADAESLKRQVVEARLAAMQAQVEPHFLFNTLASIDHLIETDSARASKMQKNLIALLRASMPGMREPGTNLGREMAVVRPYLEILRVRMGERLQTEIRVGEGLHSAEFPPMMLQSLVENAIKHGLEPKAEGGTLTVAAEVADGRLEVSVADTGVGFGQAATAGTGIGLVNIRERLKLLYGNDAELRVAENSPSGTRVTVVVPYRTAGSGTRA